MFTRSREYNKDDSCHVEQKNWSVVRQNAGYGRFDTTGELAVLRQIYALLRLHTNFFMPSVKLVEKVREGSKTRKRYDKPTTLRPGDVLELTPVFLFSLLAPEQPAQRSQPPRT